jgi:hypothetical protein
MNANDVETALRARAAFNDSVDCIDADTRRRLRELRLQALGDKPRHARARWAWSLASALAVLAVIVFWPRMPHAPATAVPATTAVVAQPVPTRAPVHPTHTPTANEIAASDSIEVVDPDMLSDIEFYGWLAKQPDADASGG